MKDVLARFHLERQGIEGICVTLDESWQDFLDKHQPPASLIPSLGKWVTLAFCLAERIGTLHELTLHLVENASQRSYLIAIDPHVRWRGMVRSDDEMSAPSTQEALSDATLTIDVRDAHGAHARSVIALPRTDDLAHALRDHFKGNEEKTPHFVFHADPQNAFGLWWQGPGLPAEAMLPASLDGFFATLQPPEAPFFSFCRHVRYHCPRDEKKIFALLRRISRREIESLLAEQGEIRFEDEICREVYRYGPEILAQLFPVSDKIETHVYPSRESIMDKTLEELIAQKEALERQIQEVLQQKRQEAIAQAKKLIADYQLKPEELFKSSPSPQKKPRAKVPPKYRDPVSGQTWTGQGRAPRWFDKNNPEAYLIRG